METNEDNAEIINTKISKREADGIKYKMVVAARKECKAYFVEFANCSKETTWKVAWACRPQLKELNGCLKLYTTDEHFEQHKLQYVRERQIRRQQQQQKEEQAHS